MSKPPGDLTIPQRNYLSRREAAGDRLTSTRMKDYTTAHHRAMADGLKPDSKKYFDAVTNHTDATSESRKVAAEQPKPSGPRFDGASVPKPRHVGGGDEFQKLRSRASTGGRYGKK